LNNRLKLHNWLTYCEKKQFHLVSMTETKLKTDSLTTLTNPLYKIFSSNFIPKNNSQREASLGTAIAVHTSICPYINNTGNFPGTAIFVDLCFPGNNKIRFISIYIPTNHPELALSTQRVINSWITEAKARNWQCIVLGDFNANHLRRDKCKVIFTHLATLSLNSLL